MEETERILLKIILSSNDNYKLYLQWQCMAKRIFCTSISFKIPLYLIQYRWFKQQVRIFLQSNGKDPIDLTLSLSSSGTVSEVTFKTTLVPSCWFFTIFRAMGPTKSLRAGCQCLVKMIANAFINPITFKVQEVPE